MFFLHDKLIGKSNSMMSLSFEEECVFIGLLLVGI